MRRIFLGLVAAVMASTIAVAARADSSVPPVAEGSIPSGYVWLSGGVIAAGKNDKGVVIKLHSQTGGVRFNLSANGMHVTLQQS